MRRSGLCRTLRRRHSATPPAFGSSSGPGKTSLPVVTASQWPAKAPQSASASLPGLICRVHNGGTYAVLMHSTTHAIMRVRLHHQCAAQRGEGLAASRDASEHADAGRARARVAQRSYAVAHVAVTAVGSATWRRTQLGTAAAVLAIRRAAAATRVRRERGPRPGLPSRVTAPWRAACIRPTPSVAPPHVGACGLDYAVWPPPAAAPAARRSARERLAIIRLHPCCRCSRASSVLAGSQNLLTLAIAHNLRLLITTHCL